MDQNRKWLNWAVELQALAQEYGVDQYKYANNDLKPQIEASAPHERSNRPVP